MEAWQKRVVEEKTELDLKIDKLVSFMGSDQFEADVPVAEQKRLRRQEVLMELYSEVLAERIENFK